MVEHFTILSFPSIIPIIIIPLYMGYFRLITRDLSITPAIKGYLAENAHSPVIPINFMAP